MSGTQSRAARSVVCRIALALVLLACDRGNAPQGKASPAAVRSPTVAAAVAAVEPRIPLPSWNDGKAKSVLLDFVASVTNERESSFVPIAERIAVFDNDGTLWSEQPVYFEVAFAIDRVRTIAQERRQLRRKPPFEALLSGDPAGLEKASPRDMAELMAATHTGMSTLTFEDLCVQWFATARHPRFHRPYTDLVFQPMLELMRHLRANGFKTYVVSGGEADFMRVFSERVYGVPPEQVIGSSVKLEYALASGQPALMRLPALQFVDDKAGKPVAIQRFIGRRPILAFGNSDGDREMLEWTTLAAPRARLGLIVHHTDGEREWAYDRRSAVGRLDRVLDDAARRNWVVVDMKRDWRVIYPFQKASEK